MAYELHIEREKAPIGLVEWESAVAAIDGARINSENSEVVNPSEGISISVGGNYGDVDIRFRLGGFLGIGGREVWKKVIRFQNGRASFKATADIDKTKSPVRKVAAALAKALSARIVGDEGEVYRW